jgi:hypothetical protein
MLTGAAKYSEFKEQRTFIFFSGAIGVMFFLLIRFIPAIGTTVFGWLPVYVWV